MSPSYFYRSLHSTRISSRYLIQFQLLILSAMAPNKLRKFKLSQEKGKLEFTGENLSEEELYIIKKTLLRREIRWWVKFLIGTISTFGVGKLLWSFL